MSLEEKLKEYKEAKPIFKEDGLLVKILSSAKYLAGAVGAAIPLYYNDYFFKGSLDFANKYAPSLAPYMETKIGKIGTLAFLASYGLEAYLLVEALYNPKRALYELYMVASSPFRYAKKIFSALKDTFKNVKESLSFSPVYSEK